MRWSSSQFAVLVATMAVAWAPSARADTGGAPAVPGVMPDADQIQFAAREHDLGYRAYMSKQYDDAATHFENAYFAAPNPAELRSAIRARRDAGALARAATLAAIGERRFPTDAATAKLAEDTIALARPRVQEVEIVSGAEYSVAVDEKIVAVEKVKESRLFVEPGDHELLVSWDDRSTRVPLEAKAGGSQTLKLEPPVVEAPPPPPTHPEEPVVVPPPPPPPILPPPVVPPPSSSRPFGPAVFLVGAGLTAVGAGISIGTWIYATNNPGAEAVKARCAGQGAGCMLYRQGLAAQTRSYVSIGVTSGIAAGTAVIGAFFTQWAPTATVAGVSVTPLFAIGGGAVEGTF